MENTTKVGLILLLNHNHFLFFREATGFYLFSVLIMRQFLLRLFVFALTPVLLIILLESNIFLLKEDIFITVYDKNNKVFQAIEDGLKETE